MSTVSLLKALGYAISTFSVVLLGIASFKGASEHAWLIVCLLVGMVASIAGMVLRWMSHCKEQDAKARRGDRVESKDSPAPLVG